MLENIFVTLLSSSTVTAVILWLTNTWLSERLKQSIAHEYAQLLERHKADLAAERALELERARAKSAEERAARAVGEDYLREVARVTHTKRVEAVQQLWSGILRITASTPEAITVTDCMTVTEIANVHEYPKVASKFEALGQSTFTILSQNRSKAAEVRLLVGEYLYALHDAYLTIVMRSTYLAIQGFAKRDVEPWYEDTSILSVIEQISTSDEFAVFQAMGLAHFTWLQSHVEDKFIAHFAQILHGGEPATMAATIARNIQRETRIVEVRSPRLTQKLT